MVRFLNSSESELRLLFDGEEVAGGGVARREVPQQEQRRQLQRGRQRGRRGLHICQGKLYYIQNNTQHTTV